MTAFGSKRGVKASVPDAFAEDIVTHTSSVKAFETARTATRVEWEFKTSGKRKYYVYERYIYIYIYIYAYTHTYTYTYIYIRIYT